MTLFLYDDAEARLLEPFSLVRPASTLRAGAEIIAQRWSVALAWSGHDTTMVVAPHLRRFREAALPSPAIEGVLPAGSVIANSRFAPVLRPFGPGDVFTSGGKLAAVRTTGTLQLAELDGGRRALEELAPDGATAIEVGGWWIEGAWDLVRHLGAMLASDLGREIGSLALDSPSQGGSGDSLVSVEAGASVSPLVAFETAAGPVVIRSGATIAPFTTLIGPCYIGRRTRLTGGRISGSSIGDDCRVQGDLSACVLVGEANKGHDGFVGHSVLGRWVNLGASTVTSNLKNTYGPVSLRLPRGEVDTGMQFLGSLIADHAKTAIGTRLNTGTVIGAGANVFGEGLTPGYIPPFAWGLTGERRWDIDRFLGVVERVMSRRAVPLGEEGRAFLRDVFGEAAR
ncbi:MAG: putative sugar nucleotidyl transferase [Gemmatimonadota bacterium]